jgi:integrase
MHSTLCGPVKSALFNERKLTAAMAWSKWEISCPVLKFLVNRYWRPYNMSHTYATAKLMSGMHQSICANQLGHSVNKIQRTYSK